MLFWHYFLLNFIQIKNKIMKSNEEFDDESKPKYNWPMGHRWAIIGGFLLFMGIISPAVSSKELLTLIVPILIIFLVYGTRNIKGMEWIWTGVKGLGVIFLIFLSANYMKKGVKDWWNKD